MPFEMLGVFILTCLVIEITPGPNMAYLAILSASYGRRAGYAATLGVALGLLIVGTGAALGLAAMISNSQLLYEALRWSGVGYLLWLAWDGWVDGTTTAENAGHDGVTPVETFRRGLLTNLLNPKAMVFFVAVLPTFVGTGRPVLPQVLTLTAIYVAVATAIHATIVTLAGTAQPFLEDPVRLRVARRVLALALAVIAVWFAASTAR
jgi:threonine/homoserine/homoserine lactone efflux protein